MKMKKFLFILEHKLTDIMFTFYTEKLDILLYFKRKKWVGKEVYGTLVKGEWELYDDTDSGRVINVFRTYKGLLPRYLYFINNEHSGDEGTRTFYIKDKKDGRPW
jgi:hypothetical protein